ncbi:MAG: glycosyltransferase [Spartobacteria bacterium]|nr:glycosyltransferase [Spartobacteria bacterium]
MKILLIAPQPFYEERGTPIAVRWVAEHFSRCGDDVDLLCYHVGQDIDVPHVTIIRAWGPPFIKRIPIGFGWKKLVCDVFLSWSMLKLIRRREYDVVHAVEEAVFPAIGIVRWLSGKKKRGLNVVYDMDSSMADQILEKWRALGFLRRPMFAMERWAMRRADLILPVCDHLAEKVRELAPHALSVVLRDQALTSEGIRDVEDIRATMALTGKMAMYVGNLEHYQGVDLILATAGQWIRLHGTDKPLHFVIIGGNDADLARYREKVQQDGLADCVHFVGRRPVDALQTFLAQADYLLSPRGKGVNTPLKVYSYMLAGKPLLATNIVSHTQVLDEDCACLLPCDEGKWAIALDALYTDETACAQMGKKARARAEKNHSVQAYDEVLSGAYRMMMK